MTDHFAASEPFFTAGTPDFTGPSDPPTRPVNKETLWTDIRKFISGDLDINSQVMLSQIVEDARTLLSEVNSEAAYLAEQREEDFTPFDDTFGLDNSQLRAAKRGTLSLAPDRERALLNNISITLYSTPLWQPEQSHRSVAELELLD